MATVKNKKNSNFRKNNNKIDNINNKNNNNYNHYDYSPKFVIDYYDNWNVEEFPEYVRTLMNYEEKLVSHIFKNFLECYFKNKDIFILDCGCGFGSYYHLTKGYQNTIYFDISLNLLKKFKNKYPNLNMICGDINSPPFKNGSFDLIMCINLLEHIDDHDKVINNLLRILKDDGLLFIVVVNKKSIFKEEIFTSFNIFHKEYSIDDFKKYNIIEHSSFYFIHSIFKILPSFLLKKLINQKKMVELNIKLGRLLNGQFLYVIIKK